MVSICIPCYNNAEEVERLLNSIVEQTYKDYEVNISDDSTNEEITEIVGNFRNRIEKLNYRHNKKPYGHILNWNEAIKMATGEYIKIMFSDDWFTDDKSLASYVKLLEDAPEAVLAFSGSRQVMLDIDNAEQLGHVTAENQKAIYDRCANQEFIENLKADYRNLFLGNQIGAPSAVIYRRGEEPALFDEKSNWASDMYLFFELLKENHTFAYTKEPLVSIGVHEHQYTEMFEEHDMRVYNDYRNMYIKYDLSKSDACKQFFLNSFIIGYGTGFKEAKSLGITFMEYLHAWLKGCKESVHCYLDCHFKSAKSVN